MRGKQIADYHVSARVLDEKVAGFHFRLHCLAAIMRCSLAHANGFAQFAGCDHDVRRARSGGSSQLQSQFMPEMIGRNHEASRAKL